MKVTVTAFKSIILLINFLSASKYQSLERDFIIVK